MGGVLKLPLYESAPSLAQDTGQYFPCLSDDTGVMARNGL